MSATTTTGIIDSPVGVILITLAGNRLTGVDFCGEEAPSADSLTGDAVDQLAEYFAGTRREFTIPVDLSSASDFTRRVLEATAAIPYGETRTYGEIAAAIGMPGATQAVGNALGANPVPIVVPCHRVIRADGSMGWFTGGPHIKRALLDIEGVHFPEQQALPF
ncbi:MAG TPA: methylated-DNA--[protein]-cysteine S-methyltransferase [Thermomicrobiales bacterium]|nr:methylated-DNA--[protein]-cysteine S-methyltransferase [Thermomicrobiales bacterium]